MKITATDLVRAALAVSGKDIWVVAYFGRAANSVAHEASQRIVRDPLDSRPFVAYCVRSKEATTMRDYGGSFEAGYAAGRDDVREGEPKCADFTYVDGTFREGYERGYDETVRTLGRLDLDAIRADLTLLMLGAADRQDERRLALVRLGMTHVPALLAEVEKSRALAAAALRDHGAALHENEVQAMIDALRAIRGAGAGA